MTYVSPTWFPPLQLTLLFKYYCRFCVLLYNSGPYHLFPIRYGTEWDVVSIGCTSCIKINFADGVVLFLAVHYGAILIYWFIFDFEKMKFCHGFKTFEVELEW